MALGQQRVASKQQQWPNRIFYARFPGLWATADRLHSNHHVKYLTKCCYTGYYRKYKYKCTYNKYDDEFSNRVNE